MLNITAGCNSSKDPPNSEEDLFLKSWNSDMLIEDKIQICVHHVCIISVLIQSMYVCRLACVYGYQMKIAAPLKRVHRAGICTVQYSRHEISLVCIFGLGSRLFFIRMYFPH